MLWPLETRYISFWTDLLEVHATNSAVHGLQDRKFDTMSLRKEPRGCLLFFVGLKRLESQDFLCLHFIFLVITVVDVVSGRFVPWSFRSKYKKLFRPEPEFR